MPSMHASSVAEGDTLTIACPNEGIVRAVPFASFGTPRGAHDVLNSGGGMGGARARFSARWAYEGNGSVCIAAPTAPSDSP